MFLLSYSIEYFCFLYWFEYSNFPETHDSFFTTHSRYGSMASLYLDEVRITSTDLQQFRYSILA